MVRRGSYRVARPEPAETVETVETMETGETVKPPLSKKEAAEARGRAAVVAREVQLARGLAANNAVERARQLRRLHRWLKARAASCFDFSEHDFMRLWKGLFYCVWMSDKPLVQEELCDDIAKLFDCFGEKNISTSVLFYRSFLKTLSADWFGIDQHRLDKFLMLVRRVTRGLLKCAKQLKWNKESTNLIETCLSGEGGLFSSSAPIEARMSLGLKLHIIDCWMEEISKVSDGDISKKAVTRLVRPFALYMSYGQENRLTSSILKNIFIYLIRQTDHGIEYREKIRQWRNAGYPGGSAEKMQKVELSDDEDENDDNDENEDEDEEFKDEKPQRKALDPRAGHVDVELPQLPVDTESINKIFRELMADPKTTNTSRNKMRDLIRKFETLGSGEYPFKMKEVMLPKNSKLKMPKVISAAYDLMDFERNIGEADDDEELHGLNKRQKRRFLMKQRKNYLKENDTETDEKPTTIIKQGRKTLKSGAMKKVLRKQTKNYISNCSEFIVTDNSPKKVQENGVVKNIKKIEENGIVKDVTKIKKDKSNKIVKENGIVKDVTKNKKDKSNKTVDVDSKITPQTKEEIPKVSVKPSKKETSPKPSRKTSIETSPKTPTKIPEETEIIIPLKKEMAKKKIEKSKKNNYLNAPNSKVIKGKITKPKALKTSFDKSSFKKLDIDLSKNTHHTIIDYVKSVRSSPKIPFDSKKKPQKTALKPNSMPSPVNPFYIKKMNLNLR